MNKEHEEEIVCLVHADNPAQAHIWQNALEQEGIFSKIVGEYLGAGLGNLPGMRTEIWVYKNEFEKARKILEEHEKRAQSE